MKDAYYFPHDSNSRQDPKLAALIQRFGLEGYGLWWGLIEIMHEQGGKLQKFPKFYEGLSNILSLNEAERKQIEATLKQLISASINDFYLLKEDDNFIWSDRVLRNLKDREEKRLKKVEAGRLGGILSGQSRAKTKQNEAPLEANEPKESKGKESKRKKEYIVHFEGLWKDYPNKDGKKQALSHFKASVKTDQDLEDIRKALVNYLCSDRVKNGFIKNGATWFNNWRDWVPVETLPKKIEGLH